jgi:four helix bundle protein
VASQADELRARTRRFAVRILKFVRMLPRDPATDTVVRQLARSGTSVSANYRAAGRARSRAEFIAKVAVVAEEADETEHWLEVLREGNLASGPELVWLCDESRELRAIFVASTATARANHRRS